MPPFFIDYKEEVKRLISESYIPSDTVSKEFEMTTDQIVSNLSNILPQNSIDSHMVYEALMELGYEPKENTPLNYFWYFQRI